jgi:hypothetical protein
LISVKKDGGDKVIEATIKKHYKISKILFANKRLFLPFIMFLIIGELIEGVNEYFFIFNFIIQTLCYSAMIPSFNKLFLHLPVDAGAIFRNIREHWRPVFIITLIISIMFKINFDTNLHIHWQQAIFQYTILDFALFIIKYTLLSYVIIWKIQINEKNLFKRLKVYVTSINFIETLIFIGITYILFSQVFHEFWILSLMFSDKRIVSYLVKFIPIIIESICKVYLLLYGGYICYYNKSVTFTKGGIFKLYLFVLVTFGFTYWHIGYMSNGSEYIFQDVLEHDMLINTFREETGSKAKTEIIDDLLANKEFNRWNNSS